MNSVAWWSLVVLTLVGEVAHLVGLMYFAPATMLLRKVEQVFKRAGKMSDMYATAQGEHPEIILDFVGTNAHIIVT